MKKLLTVLLAALLICGSAALPRMAAAEEKTPAEYGFNTLKDVFGYESPSYSLYGDVYILVFSKDDAYYRAVADVPADVYEKLDALDFFDENYEANQKALLQDLPIRSIIDLTEALLSPEDLDALKGKTGQELTDMGFVPQGSYGFWEDGTMFYLVKGPFAYEVNFVEALEPQDNPNIPEVMAPLTVKSAAFAGVSAYATEVDFDIHGSPVWEYWEEPEAVFYEIPEIPVAESAFRTLADAFAVRGEEYSSSLSYERFALAFPLNGAYYRVEADIPEEVADQLDAIDFFDEERDEKQEALLGPLPVTRVGDLSAGIPPQEELDALKGLTGQELLDMGFDYGMGYMFGESSEMYLTWGLYEYHIYYREKVSEADDYEAILDELMQVLTVDRVEFFGLSGICSDPDLLW